MALRSAPRDATCALAMVFFVLGGPGCYQGDWRIGAEVPIGTTSRLLPTRDIERWELEPTVTPYVVRLNADLRPRCRNARFGSSRRTDTGVFKRTGGGYWAAAAITSGGLAGIAGIAGGSGWIARDGGPYAPPALYAVGGLIAVGGLVTCVLAAKQGSTTTRKVLCGVLSGAGVSMLAGTVLQQELFPKPPTAGETDVLKTLTFAGAGTLGVALGTGIVAGLWRGQTERTQVVDKPDDSLWDRQQGEVTCGPPKPLVGRTATLEIFAERAPEGPGSEAEPLKLKVAVNEEGKVPVDLRPLRTALQDCGVLRVQVDPDTIYEQFLDDFTPAAKPDPGSATSRPIQGRIVPREGITLQGMEGKSKKNVSRLAVPGFEEEVVARVERRCRAEIARAQPGRALSAAPVVVREPEVPPLVRAPIGPMREPEPPEEEFQQSRRRPEPEVPPLVMQNGGAPSGGARGGECSAQARQTLYRDCEHTCSKSLDIGECLFDRRKCQIDARYSQQKQRDMELCDLAWERCIFKVGRNPAAWDRCVESCQKANEPAQCREQQ